MRRAAGATQSEMDALIGRTARLPFIREKEGLLRGDLSEEREMSQALRGIRIIDMIESFDLAAMAVSNAIRRASIAMISNHRSI